MSVCNTVFVCDAHTIPHLKKNTHTEKRAPGGHGGPERLVFRALGGDAVEGHAFGLHGFGSWAFGA